MPNPFEEGDELKKQYMEKALHANEEAISGVKFTDLMNKDSSIYKDQNTEIPKEKPPVPEKPTTDAEGYPIIQNVHTYREDLAGIVNEDKLSLSRIAMMQNGVKQEIPKSHPKEKDLQTRIFKVTAIILFIMSIGIIGGVVMIMNQKKAEEVAIVNTPKEKYIIYAEQKQDFDITKSTKTEIGARLKSAKAAFKEEDSIMEIVPTTNDGTAIIKSSISTLFEKTGLRIPSELTRTLSSKFFFGLYSKKGRTDPFLVMFTNSYDIAYPSLLDWEGYMRDDMDWLYDTKPIYGTTTPTLTFKDRIISNRDARSFEDNLGRTAFFYAFLDDNTILFANTSDTIRKVIDRLREAKFQ